MIEFKASDNRIWYFPDSERHFQEVLGINPEYQFKMKSKLMQLETKLDFSYVLDVGANVGLWTLWFIAAGAERVDCFEPMESNFECLVKNTDNVGSVKLYKKAVGETAGNITLYTTESNSNTGTASMISSGTLSVPHEVECITIDSLNINPTFIKLDIQGAEIYALRGAAQTILRCMPGILLECEDDKSAIEYLKTFGYKIAAFTTSDYLMLPSIST